MIYQADFHHGALNGRTWVALCPSGAKISGIEGELEMTFPRIYEDEVQIQNGSVFDGYYTLTKDRTIMQVK